MLAPHLVRAKPRTTPPYSYRAAPGVVLLPEPPRDVYAAGMALVRAEVDLTAEKDRAKSRTFIPHRPAWLVADAVALCRQYRDGCSDVCLKAALRWASGTDDTGRPVPGAESYWLSWVDADGRALPEWQDGADLAENLDFCWEVPGATIFMTRPPGPTAYPELLRRSRLTVELVGRECGGK